MMLCIYSLTASCLSCGHNLIAVAGIGAAVSLSKAMVEHNLSGKIVLLGTPAEEGGGGKIILQQAGAYDGMDICLMTHPTPASAFTPMFARAQSTFDYTGHPAHAALSPEQGVNALDACVTAYNSVSFSHSFRRHAIHSVWQYSFRCSDNKFLPVYGYI
jgi:metal-dependent amidase/aminoacylase/carboxypeptidase family protein